MLTLCGKESPFSSKLLPCLLIYYSVDLFSNHFVLCKIGRHLHSQFLPTNREELGNCNILGSYDIECTPDMLHHDDVIKWKLFLRYWPFVRGIHRSPVNSPHKGQWRRALMFSLNCAWTNTWANNWDVIGLRRHRANYDVMVMTMFGQCCVLLWFGLDRCYRNLVSIDLIVLFWITSMVVG